MIDINDTSFPSFIKQQHVLLKTLKKNNNVHNVVFYTKYFNTHGIGYTIYFELFLLIYE